MTPRIQEMLQYYVQEKKHHQFRKGKEDKYRFAVKYKEAGLSELQRTVERLKDVLAEETPIVIPGEKIAFLRTVETLPEILTEEELAKATEGHYVHEQGKICNIAPDYEKLLSCGLLAKIGELQGRIAEFEKAGDQAAAEYDQALLDTLQIILDFTARYQAEAEKVGNTAVAEVLAKVPAKAPETFYEALQFMRVIRYCLWCSYNYHIVFGRFDQYMYPYYKADMEAGRLDKDSALELLEEFFICSNKDSDLYTGMQQGDNGQSMVLGGLNADGSESFNDLSDLCLQASLELKLIDPKINVRVNKNTPLSLYERGTQLTKQGLGFPQYSNDDVVFEALKNWGYEEKDYTNYCMAACWEFIIPGAGMDIPNINGLSFPKCTLAAVNRLPEFASFEDLMADVKKNIFAEAVRLRKGVEDLYTEPAPLMSLMMDGCAENGIDIGKGCKYNNYGFHGTGIATAVDSLASVRKYVFEDKTVTAEQMVDALQKDFEGYEELCNTLRYEGPKMGNNDDATDELATILLDWFADSMRDENGVLLKNDRGGIYRTGTGSAMYYIWQSENEQATPDGRRKGEEFACNYSPSIFTSLDGPISIIQSFTKPNLYRVANGGPLTIELSDSMFRTADSEKKTAQFVKTFIDLGGHQLQINAVNREQLLDAKAHPENHRNLIVRVWGWSGYFVELDECYQNHIIKRMELVV